MPDSSCLQHTAGEIGKIDGSFGTAGKFRVSISSECWSVSMCRCNAPPVQMACYHTHKSSSRGRKAKVQQQQVSAVFIV